MKQRITAVAILNPGHFGDEDVRSYTRFHRQKVLSGDQIEVDVCVLGKKTWQLRCEPEG